MYSKINNRPAKTMSDIILDENIQNIPLEIVNDIIQNASPIPYCSIKRIRPNI